jgi:hypothetical protein
MERSYRGMQSTPSVVLRPDCPLSPMARLLYIGFALHADEATLLGDPSIADLAGTTNLSRSSVVRLREELIEQGFIELVESGRKTADGGHAPNLYRVLAGVR